ncbi:MAG: 3-deoxy-manno-octulosonate cytidylyltransferase [bacterium]|nr:3-deoxy-manno-octulosonate cytidylyltransferase [Candidatus Sumerlaeota bacterium]
MKIIGVIPARYASTRLPAKPLVMIAGQMLVERVWRAARLAESLDEVWIATDDERIAAPARAFGATVAMTPPECPSGTDRIAAAIEGREADIVVNIQGDEPLMSASNIDACVRALANDPAAAVSTPMVALVCENDYRAPHVVKVVCDSSGYALYFSRAPIPDMSRMPAAERAAAAAAPLAMKHLGLYVYRRTALEAFVKMPPSRYETAEKLEQLRFIEAGCRIRMVQVEHDSIGVDTPEDVAAVEKKLAEMTRTV